MATESRSFIAQPRSRCTTQNNNNTITPTAVVGCNIPLTPGRYVLRAVLKHQSAAATTGLRVRIAAIGGLVGTMSDAHCLCPTAAAAVSPSRIAAPAFGTDIISTGVVAANTDQTSKLTFVVNITTAGTAQLQWGSEVAASASILQVDSLFWAEAFI
jgi:hypothetical protein